MIPTLQQRSMSIIVMQMMRIVCIAVIPAYRIVRLSWHRYQHHATIHATAKVLQSMWIYRNIWPTVRCLTRNTAPSPPLSTMRFVFQVSRHSPRIFRSHSDLKLTDWPTITSTPLTTHPSPLIHAYVHFILIWSSMRFITITNIK